MGHRLPKKRDKFKSSDDKWNSYKENKQMFAIAASITGGLWAINVVDAFFMGKRANKKFKLYFSSNPVTQVYCANFTFNF